MKKLILALAFCGFAGMPAVAQDARTLPAPAGLTEPVQLAQVSRYPRRWERYPGRRYGRPARCRWVTERRIRPNGTVVVRRIQRCW